jgi:hypothetical protein
LPGFARELALRSTIPMRGQENVRRQLMNLQGTPDGIQAASGHSGTPASVMNSCPTRIDGYDPATVQWVGPCRVMSATRRHRRGAAPRDRAAARTDEVTPHWR